ncbi:MAG TPA: hypothetical protein VK066_20030 [Chloroflexota bacterium]|nr:hypothetical protein [Chloroflexota bacterium]
MHEMSRRKWLGAWALGLGLAATVLLGPALVLRQAGAESAAAPPPTVSFGLYPSFQRQDFPDGVRCYIYHELPERDHFACVYLGPTPLPLQ